MPDPTQRIRDNVAKMRAQNASDADVEHYLRDVEGLSPVSGASAAPVDAPRPAAAPDEEPGYGKRFVTTILNAAQGIPGMEAVEAEAGSLGSKLTDSPLSYQESLKTLRDATGQIPKGRKLAGKALGAVAAAPFLPANPTAAGAILGGGDEALAADDESLGERAKNTVLGTAAGAATGKVLGGVGKGIATLGQKTGATDAIAAGARKLGDIVPGPVGDGLTNIGESIGTRGAGNKLLNDRQSILDQLTGSEKDAAQTVADHADAYHAQAKKLYDVARADTKVVDDPRVQDALADPRVQQMLGIVRARVTGGNAAAAEGAMTRNLDIRDGFGRVRRDLRGVSDDALGTEWQRLAERNAQEEGENAAVEEAGYRENYEALPSMERTGRSTRTVDAFGNKIKRQAEDLPDADGLIDSEDLARDNRTASDYRRGAIVRQAREQLMQRIQEELASRPSADAFGFGANKSASDALPTPEELALTKRLLSSVVQRKFNAPTGIDPAEAAQMVPKLDQLRAALHDASPAWKDADAYYAQAKNLETAFSKAYGAQQKVTAAGLEPRKLKTQEAISRWADDAAGTPIGDARAAGQQAGSASRIAESVRNAPLEPTISETLGGAGQIFQPSEAAAALRRPAFASDDAAEAFAKLVGKLQRATPPSPPATKNPLTWGRPFNPLTTEAGSELRQTLAAQLANPSKEAALRAMMASSARGRALLAALTRSAVPAANAPFASP